MSKGAYKQQQISARPPKGGIARKCPQCGKEFYPTPHWAYRNNKTVWCSWKCLRENETGIPPHREPEKEPERPLTDEQMARLAEIDAHERQVATEIPVMIARATRDELERKQTGGYTFRSRRTEDMARRAYEAIQAGTGIDELVAEYQCHRQYIYTLAARYRAMYNLPALPRAERQRRAGKAVQKRFGLDTESNHSGEKTARLAAVMGRCRALLAEIRKEAGISA